MVLKTYFSKKQNLTYLRKISLHKIYIWTYILSVKLYENRRNFKMQCPLLLNHISFWILKDIFVPHTHTRTLENWVIFYLHSSQNDFFFLFGEIVRAYINSIVLSVVISKLNLEWPQKARHFFNSVFCHKF